MTTARLSRRGYKARAIYPVWRYGATGDGQADDTAAIQDAIDAAAAAGGGTVLFPVGVFLVAGSMKTYNVSKKAQVLIPTDPRDMTAALPWAGIRLVGEGANPLPVWGDIPTAGMTMPKATGSATIRSPDGTPGGSIFGVPQATVTTFFPVGPESALSVEFNNLIIATYADPRINAIDMQEALNLKVDRVLICGQDSFYAAAQPVNGGIALRSPNVGNGSMVTLGEVIVYGFTTGFSLSEHAVFSNINAFGCGKALSLNEVNHSVGGGRLLVQNCLTGVSFDTPNGSFPISVQFRLDFEHQATGWPSGGYDVNDPNNYGKGLITYSMGGGGTTSAIAVNGGINLTLTNLGR